MVLFTSEMGDIIHMILILSFEKRDQKEIDPYMQCKENHQVM
jgi:hypothetical protein